MRHSLVVPRAGDKFYATGSIYGWRPSCLTFLHRVVADWKSTSSLCSHPKPLLNFLSQYFEINRIFLNFFNWVLCAATGILGQFSNLCPVFAFFSNATAF